MLRTLYSKLALTLAALFLLLGGLFFFLMRSSFDTQQLAVEQQLNQSLAERLVTEYFANRDETRASEADRALFTTMMHINPNIELYRLDARGGIVAFSAPSGKVVRTRIDLAPVKRFLEESPQFPLKGEDPRDTQRTKIFSAAPIRMNGKTTGYLYVVLGAEEQDTISERLSANHGYRSAIGLMVGGVGLALIVGFVLFRLLTVRLERLARAMDSFRASEFSAAIPYSIEARAGHADEIDRLGMTYNQMAERIAAQLQELRESDAARRDVIANVSHDLRTPLASLRGYLETLLMKGDSLTAEERNVYLETAAKQSERLSKLVTQFFELAKLDARDVRLELEPFVLEELVQDVSQSFELRARAKGISIVLRLEEGMHFVLGDIGLIERALENLIENAVRHTSLGTVTVSVLSQPQSETHRERVQVNVIDTGTGIPEEALPHVFERSFTLDKSRTGASGGSGLGLAIAKRVIELHDGSLRVRSAPGEGSCFSFDLPVVQAPSSTAQAAQTAPPT